MYVQLHIAQCHKELDNQYLRASLLELKEKGLNLKFERPSEMTFKDVSGKLPST